METPYHQLVTPPSNWLRRLIRTIAGTGPGAWMFSHTLHHLDRLTLRLTGGHMAAAAVLGGLPLVTVTTIGAKSGQPRSIPLVGIPDEQNIILIASNWGNTRHPAWYHNVCAHSEVTVTVNGRSLPYMAHELSGAERDRCWQKAVATYAGYTAYVRRAGNRQIPVMLLVPQKK